MNEFNKIPAQLLLQDRSVTYSSYLERKVMKLTFKHWIKNYAIISDGNLYIYSSNLSPKPNLVCMLSAFNEIRIISDRTDAPFWVFHMIPIIDNIPVLKLAAASHREMGCWISNLRKAIIQSKQKQLQRIDTNKSNYDESDNASIYSIVSDEDTIRNNLKIRNQSSIYEESEDILVNIGNTEPTAPPMDFQLYPDLNKISDSIESMDLSKITSDELVLYYGSRDSAYNQLTQTNLIGAYLVRVNDKRKILTVICPSSIMKYCIISDSNMSNRVCLMGQHESFDSIDHLIYYYHNNKLPNQNVKLIAPFKLIMKN